MTLPYVDAKGFIVAEPMDEFDKSRVVLVESQVLFMHVLHEILSRSFAVAGLYQSLPSNERLQDVHLIVIDADFVRVTEMDVLRIFRASEACICLLSLHGRSPAIGATRFDPRVRMLSKTLKPDLLVGQLSEMMRVYGRGASGVPRENESE